MRGVGEVEAGDADAAARRPGKLIAIVGVEARQRAMQRLGVDLALQLELVGGGAEPPAGRLALAGVLVLDALADGLEVVVGLAGSELSDRQHDPTDRARAVGRKPQVLTDLGEDGT